MNAGERDELIFKLLLTQMRDTNTPLFGEKISSVGFLGIEYGSLPPQINIQLIKTLSDNELQNIANKLYMSKAPSGAKSDVYINNIGVSLKSHSAAPAALVNHTARPGFEFACLITNSSIVTLDSIIEQYWVLRESGVITEDTKISDLNCPFKSYKEYLRPILEYFLFTGTGSKVSATKAQYLLEFSDPCDIRSCNKLTPADAVDAVWPKLIFSLRAKKGMPSNYDLETYTGKNADSIKKWVHYHSGDYRGALHIRSSK